jgi:hypothetical protein
MFSWICCALRFCIRFKARAQGWDDLFLFFALVGLSNPPGHLWKVADLGPAMHDRRLRPSLCWYAHRFHSTCIGMHIHMNHVPCGLTSRIKHPTSDTGSLCIHCPFPKFGTLSRYNRLPLPPSLEQRSPLPMAPLEPSITKRPNSFCTWPRCPFHYLSP